MSLGTYRWEIVLLLAILIPTSALAASEDPVRKIKVKVAPVYPELARRMSVTGSVKLQVVVSPNGTVKAARVIGGHPLLVDPALVALKKWKYEAGAEETVQIVEFKFNPAP